MDLEEYIFQHQHRKLNNSAEPFLDYLYFLMDKHGITNPAMIYKKVGISRQLWSSVISGKSEPSLKVCVKIALGMQLTNQECKYLLKKAGYTLSSSSRFALIIRYAIENEIYDIYKVNEMLMEHGCQDSILI